MQDKIEGQSKGNIVMVTEDDATPDSRDGQSKNTIIMVTEGPSIPDPREWRIVNAWSIALIIGPEPVEIVLQMLRVPFPYRA